MKFGIREVCDCDFYAYNGTTVATSPTFTIDTAKMSTLEQSSTTVYAQGGKGFSRLAAWEGEKSVTFTVEDAILTTESFKALMGANYLTGADANTIRVKSTSFAGYYKIIATTLVRNIDSGVDEKAVITFYKAKLQSSLNLSMAPNGDPSAFTFTFDVFPYKIDDNNKDVLYDFKIDNVNTTAVTPTIVKFHKSLLASGATTIANIEDKTGGEIVISVNTSGNIQYKSETISNTTTLSSGLLTDLVTAVGKGEQITIPAGKTVTLYMI